MNAITQYCMAQLKHILKSIYGEYFGKKNYIAPERNQMFVNKPGPLKCL